VAISLKLMLSTEFSEVFSKFPNVHKVFKGTYCADKLPKSLSPCEFAIVNTDLSNNPGIHWYVVFCYDKNSLEIFDSLSIDDSKKTFIKNNFRLKRIRDIEFNTTIFQRDDSDSCGKHCIYFIINRLYNLDHSFKRLLSIIYCNNKDENEKRVDDFYNNCIN